MHECIGLDKEEILGDGKIEELTCAVLWSWSRGI
jgi:hypothetical protein